jgi:pyruvate/2-oxoglutarate dehydrogenase complex dihydrolipoamide acyltransferase (E2) component
MALLQNITVPLLAVNDNILTVVEISFKQGDLVKKGDTVMVFETSKTTYPVEAEVEGYIQYYCKEGNDYEVNHKVACIYSEKNEGAQPSPLVNANPAANKIATTESR